MESKGRHRTGKKKRKSDRPAAEHDSEGQGNDDLVPPNIHMQHPGPERQLVDNEGFILSDGGGPMQIPQSIEMNPQDGPGVSKFSKKKRKAKHGVIKIFQDAANSCRIEVDDDGNILSVMMSDDLANTYIKFGREDYGETDPIILLENRLIPITPKKKAFVKPTHRPTRFLGNQLYYDALETVGGLGQNKKYKKVKLKKTKLKSKKADVELLYAADKTILVVDEYTDKVGKVYVAFPDSENHKTYLYSLPERLNVITEEFSREIPIRRAVNDKADWYVQDVSSEESEEEYEHKPLMATTAIDAVDDEMPGAIQTKNAIGFNQRNAMSKSGAQNPRLILQ